MSIPKSTPDPTERGEKRRGRPRDPAKEAALLKAAGDLFLEKGFEAVSLDAVAHAAGISKTTIYARFGDKETLFQTVIEATCGRFVTPDSFEPLPDLSIRDCLIQLGRRFIALLTSEEAIGLHRALVAETGKDKRMAELFFESAVVRLQQRVADWFRRETAAGRLAINDPDGAAWRFMGAAKGEVHLRASLGLAQRPEEDIEANLAALADEFLRAHCPS